MNHLKQLVGLRTIKTGIAVFLAVIIAKIGPFEYPFFMGMTAIIAMDKTMSKSIIMGRNRVLGTLLGAIIGVLLSYVDRGNALLCGIGIIILILLCNKFNLQGSITIGGIVMLAIMVHTDKTPIFYGFHRTLDTLIGASIAFIVNAMVFPYFTLEKLDELTIDIWNQTDKLVLELEQRNIVSFTEIKNNLEKIGIELANYDNELMLRKKREYVDKIKKHYDMAKRLLLEASIIETINDNNEVFDYHINKALNIYQEYIIEVQKKAA